MEKNTIICQAAKQYLGYNLSVIPTKADKRPLIRWESYRETRMQEEAAEYSFRPPNAKGIAIICGRISDNLEVIDVDCKYDRTGKLWRDFYHLLKAGLPDLLQRITIATTVNKGYHLYYRCSEIEGNKKLANNEQHEVLIETRGEGGYVIASPTPGYEFVQGDLQNIPVITPEERMMLLNISKSFDAQLIQTPMIESNSKIDGISPFEDYNQKADTVGLMVSHGWQVVKEDADRVYLKRPGETKNPVSANYHKNTKIFYPFTTSTVFENKGYNPTGVYAELEANGDFSLASKQLYEAGYGDRHPETEPPAEESTKEAAPLQPLPIDGFPEMLRDIIDACASTYKTPRDYWAGAVIIASALGIGNKFELLTRYKNSPVLWLVLVGDVSSGKSHPIDFCLDYFKSRDARSIDKYEKEMDEYQRISNMSRKERQEEGIDEKMAKPECFQYILNDFTPEAMVAAHKANNRGMLIVRDELKGWIDDFNRYTKSGEQSNMLSSWSGYGITYNRKTAGIMSIPNPCLSVCGGMQPELLPSLAADSRAENGFLSRFCAVYPDHTEKAKYSREVLPPEIIEQWEEYLSRLISLNHKQKLRLGHDADLLYEEWFNHNSKIANKEPVGFLKGVYAKLDVISLRLAVIMRGMYMACDGIYSDEITGEEMEAAISLTEYFRATAIKVYNRIFEEALNYKPDKKIIIKTLYKDFGAHKGDIAKILKTCRAQVDRVLKKEG